MLGKINGFLRFLAKKGLGKWFGRFEKSSEKKLLIGIFKTL
ncbi:hypothetical protein ADIS_0291 [Lunatimonas lonarensis]|uniref:Uncharacterized protein n=1 Tax=Lunatimonas lonarensis TaxID=1232681 RepID=R7ZYL0_9BACT|nr:hypothetical protein ADIS_0291 [Lunatimonas lonarensis]